MSKLTLDTDKEVFFYEQDHYYLSNFSSFQIYFQPTGTETKFKEPLFFPTVEHAYHWRKFESDPLKQNAIRGAVSAHKAFELGQRWKQYRCEEWDSIKVDWMLVLLELKVIQHEYVRRKLLATGDSMLIENSWRDSYWGWGEDRKGLNMLGQCWMGIRSKLQAGKI